MSQPDHSDLQDKQVVSTQHTLSQAVYARRADYTRPRSLRIKIGSWNVAAYKGCENDLGGWFVDGKGLSEALSGLGLSEQDYTQKEKEGPAEHHHRTKPIINGETAEQQEYRQYRREDTLPRGEEGPIPVGSEVGLYVLGVQEVVDVNSATEALRPYTDNSTAKKYQQALEDALPRGYVLIAEQQLIGLLLLIYASPQIASEVTSVSTTSVGTGLLGYMGNKGAVTARIILGDTTRLVFINSHLASGTSSSDLERRNWDVAQIVSRTKFDPVVDSMGVEKNYGEKIGDEDFAFWFGDLNYRLEGVPADDVRRLLHLHTRHEYDHGPSAEVLDNQIDEDSHSMKDRLLHRRNRSSTQSSHGSSINSLSPTNTSHGISSRFSNILQHIRSSDVDHDDPHLDPSSLQATIDSLLPHDQLRQQQHARKAFENGWKEGPITFLPTYKYDLHAVGVFDSSEKKRGPSWCDRILFRTRADKLAHEAMLEEERASYTRDKAMTTRGVDTAVEDENTLFEYDPDVDGDDGDDDDDAANNTGLPPSKVTTKEGFEDILQLEYYVSHQRVLSSDHKPLDAVFHLKYEAIIPELKAKVQQEVVREIDRAENEGRPVIALVIDGGQDTSGDSEGINFGGIRYIDHVKVRSLTVANIGQVEAQFGFVSHPGPDGKPRATPPWLTLGIRDVVPKGRPEEDVPHTYILQPGETCPVELIAGVHDLNLVRDLNDGQTLEDVLVLRVKDGRDHFVPVRGLWKTSAHGWTLDKLSRIPEGGVRLLQRQKPQGQGSTGKVDEIAVKFSVPREIFRLTEATEAITERYLADWTMTNDFNTNDPATQPPWSRYAGWPFIEAGWMSDEAERYDLKVALFEALDSDQPFNEHLPQELPALEKLELFADSLLMFLKNLLGGIISDELWIKIDRDFFSDKARAKQNVEEQREAILSLLPNVNRGTFILIVSTLSRVLQETSQAVDDMTPSARSNLSPPLTSGFPLPKRTLSKEPVIARRQLAEEAFATIFGRVLIRLPAAEIGKQQSDERRTELLRIFLQRL